MRTSKIVIWITFWSLAAFTVSLTGCQSDMQQTAKPRSMPERDINDVINEHSPRLMAMHGVVGTYVGARSDSTLCIRVMVIKKTAELEAEIPSELEGHPVEIEETGEIRPLND